MSPYTAGRDFNEITSGKQENLTYFVQNFFVMG